MNRPLLHAATSTLLVLALMQAMAQTVPGNPTQRRVSLWLSSPSPAGQLERCGQPLPASRWGLAASDMWLASNAVGTRVQYRGRANGLDDLWAQHCFQLRSGDHILAQGALLPTHSARRLPASLPVLVLENRARHVPWLTLRCGFPDASSASPPPPQMPPNAIVPCPAGQQKTAP